MNKKYGLAGMLLLTILVSCKTSAPTRSGTAATTFSVAEVDFNYLTAKSSVKFANEEKNLNASADFRIRKDSIIWVSVSPGLGIEAARGIITHDSIIFINRLEKTYQAKSMAELSKKFNFNLNYSLIQAALLGNLLLPIDSTAVTRKRKGQFVLRQQQDPFTVSNFVSNRSMKIEKVEVKDEADNELAVAYNDFQPLEGSYLLPFSNDIRLQYFSNKTKKAIDISIQYKRVNLQTGSLRFPFQIPEKYERE